MTHPVPSVQCPRGPILSGTDSPTPSKCKQSFAMGSSDKVGSRATHTRKPKSYRELGLDRILPAWAAQKNLHQMFLQKNVSGTQDFGLRPTLGGCRSMYVHYGDDKMINLVGQALHPDAM